MLRATAKLGGRALLVSAALLFGSAEAAVYAGHFDPILFAGDARFEVPDTCVAADEIVFTSDCGAVDFLDGLVTNHDAPPVTGTLTFQFDADALFALRWVGGQLIGVDSFGAISFAPPNGTFNNPDGYSLQFFSGASSSTLTSFVAQQEELPRVLLLARFCDGEECSFEQVGDPALQDPFVRQTTPEPGSLALICGALLAGWLTRRRIRASR